MSISRQRLQQQHGFSLIEVLISVVIISIGLLGVASMQYVGLRDSNRSGERGQATILAYDMADRMRMNPQAVYDGQYLIDADTPPAAPPGSDGSPETYCLTNFSGTAIPNFCDPQNLADADTYNWFQGVEDILPGGVASITCIDSDAGDGHPCSQGSVHLITLMWDEQREGVTGTNCSGDLSVDRFCLSVDVQI